MSVFIRSQGRLIRELCGNVRKSSLTQQLKYSQQKIPDSPIVSKKKKYLYTAFLGASIFGFAYYVNKEREYGNMFTKENVHLKKSVQWFNEVLNYHKFSLNTALMKERAKALKQAGIGGKWELIDPSGNKVSTDLLKGKWCMIYFGFTHCPGLIAIEKVWVFSLNFM